MPSCADSSHLSTFAVLERQSGIVYLRVTDETGALVEKAAISAITLNLYHQGQHTTINGRNHQDVLDVNGGEYFDSLQTTQDPDGNDITYNFSWTYEPDDQPFLRLDTGNQTEVHIAHFQFYWNSGMNSMGHVIEFTVRNIKLFP